MKKLQVTKAFSTALLYISPLSLLHAGTFGIPDADTGLLVSIVSNTTEQITRLEKLLTNSEKQLEYTRQLKETSEALESSYDRLSNIQNSLNALVSIGQNSPEDLRALNDKIEEIQGQKERIAELIKESRKVEIASEQISEESKINTVKTREIVKIDQEQIKRANSGSVKNQGQETSKNTAYINSKLTETNLLLRKSTETNAKTNALFAKNIEEEARKEQKNLEFMGIIPNPKKKEN